MMIVGKMLQTVIGQPWPLLYVSQERGINNKASLLFACLEQAPWFSYCQPGQGFTTIVGHHKEVLY